MTVLFCFYSINTASLYCFKVYATKIMRKYCRFYFLYFAVNSKTVVNNSLSISVKSTPLLSITFSATSNVLSNKYVVEDSTPPSIRRNKFSRKTTSKNIR